ncbi:hypothetical protein HYE21_00830 [Mycoplasmopsis bovis]|nr:hypothetical protein [Mycoplasmopsis bovis]QQH24233.1 hypothetical protein HYE21_00830 [Mycoplasmopsis bovis]
MDTVLIHLGMHQDNYRPKKQYAKYFFYKFYKFYKFIKLLKAPSSWSKLIPIPIGGAYNKNGLKHKKRIKKRYFWVLKSAKFCVDVNFYCICLAHLKPEKSL